MRKPREVVSIIEWPRGRGGMKVYCIYICTCCNARSISVDSKDIVQSLNSPANRSVMPRLYSASGHRVTRSPDLPRPPAAPPNFRPLTRSTYYIKRREIIARSRSVKISRLLYESCGELEGCVTSKFASKVFFITQ